MPIRSPEYMEDMRERILTATSECLERIGLANMSLTDVCNQAKISRGALYVHFESKSALLCGVVERAAKRTAARCRFSDAVTLRDFMIEETRFLLSSSAGLMYAEVELVAAARTDPEMRDAVQRNFEGRAEVFLAGMQGLRDRDELRDGLSVEAACEIVCSFLDGLLMRPVGTLGRREVYREAVNALLAGMLKPDILKNLSIKAAA